MANQDKAAVSGEYLEYLGKPLVREGDTICYGDMNEKCILIMEILSYKDKDGKHRGAFFSQGDKQVGCGKYLQIFSRKRINYEK